MRFSDYTDIKTDEYGFQFVKDSVMIGTYDKPCMLCGKPTKYIEVFTEQHFCSDECVDRFYREMDKKMQFEEEMNKLTSTYGISEHHAGCYICNYEDKFICHEFNNGCDSVDKCRSIYEKEMNNQ